MNKVLKKVINIIIDIIVVVILLISLLVVILSVTSKSAGVPNVFGVAPMAVETDSMKDTINEGDLIFSKLTDGKTELKENDIVTFYQNIQGEQRLNTHRIIEITEHNGEKVYRTKGDNNFDPDEELKTADQIVAIYTGTKIPVIGRFFNFIRTQLGFFLVILLPMIIFFIYEAIRVIMNIIAYNKEKALEAAAETVANSELTEEQKQRAIAEYLAQQKAQQETPTQDSDAEV
jgi:signal peptidase